MIRCKFKRKHLYLYLKRISFLFTYTLFVALGVAQNTSYTSLFTNANFTKTIDLSKPVGATPGSANITPSGGANYSIPVYAPPGTNGMEPSISLVYSSQILNGVAGIGWNISGLPVITRAGKNIYNNGIVSPVAYTSDDAFLLDGMRLNVISGTNGANEAVYAGELETFSKIISYTSVSANNPDWFSVTAKDGSVLEFGKTNDSRMRTNNDANVIMWRLNKVTDANGNYIEYKYINADRDSRIDEINYTGNSNTGQLPYNQLKFTYTIRTDETTVYDGGSSLNSKYLLDKIVITHNYTGSPEIVKNYKLNYGFDNISSFLKEVIESDGASSGLNSTIFLYGDKPQNLSVQSTTSLTGAYDFFSGDFDADGKTDLLAASLYYDNSIKYHSKYELRSNFSNSSSTLMYATNLSTNNAITKAANIYNFLTYDYSGDGRDDILLAKTSIQTITSTEKTIKNRFYRY